MKERPILFSGPMVRAILEGRKTVTRRAITGGQVPAVDPNASVDGMRWSAIGQRHPRYGFCVFGSTEEECARELGLLGVCPYGKPGDRLWVRETWCGPVVDPDELQAKRADGWAQFRKPEYCQYRASGGCNEYFDESRDETVARWRPSIHMPRWASRILLEITSVRVERLQDISEEQAEAEGVERPENITNVDVWDGAERELFNAMNQPRARFQRLWGDINGSDSWAANPWVWVVEFKRVTP